MAYTLQKSDLLPWGTAYFFTTGSVYEDEYTRKHWRSWVAIGDLWCVISTCLAGLDADGHPTELAWWFKCMAATPARGEKTRTCYPVFQAWGRLPPSASQREQHNKALLQIRLGKTKVTWMHNNLLQSRHQPPQKERRIEHQV